MILPIHLQYSRQHTIRKNWIITCTDTFCSCCMLPWILILPYPRTYGCKYGIWLNIISGQKFQKRRQKGDNILKSYLYWPFKSVFPWELIIDEIFIKVWIALYNSSRTFILMNVSVYLIIKNYRLFKVQQDSSNWVILHIVMKKNNKIHQNIFLYSFCFFLTFFSFFFSSLFICIHIIIDIVLRRAVLKSKATFQSNWLKMTL